MSDNHIIVNIQRQSNNTHIESIDDIAITKAGNSRAEFLSGSQLHLNNAVHANIHVWFSNSHDSSDNHSRDLIEGWEAFANADDEIVLSAAQDLTSENLRVKPFSNPRTITVHVSLGARIKPGLVGTGRTKSADIDVTP